MKSGGRLDAHGSNRISACRSEYELFQPGSDIVVVGGPSGGGTLKASSPDAKEKRRELISAVRGGQHVELVLKARVFRQRDGSPNLNFLRLNPAKMSAIAESFKGQPMLLDHNKWEQSARIGTILESAAEDQAHGWAAITQSLQVVKPEAVISVLDGTLDRFSIGWRAMGPVLCTVHRTDKLSAGRCSCWPGDKVELDGVKQTVEFQFQDATGTETSGVNVPAVSGTRIEDVRAALSAELGLSLSHSEDFMSFAKLAALLGIAALAEANDEDRAVRVVEELKRDKLAAEQERDAAILRAEKAEGELTADVEERKKTAQLARKANVDAMLDRAYTGGKLIHGRDDAGKATPSLREARLRRIGMEDGEEALAAELAEMPKLVPIGSRAVLPTDPIAPKAAANESNLSDAVLASTAKQLGLTVEEMKKSASELAEEGK